jgi:hypothetical protein
VVTKGALDMLLKGKTAERYSLSFADENLVGTEENPPTEEKSDQTIDCAETPAFCPTVQGGGEYISNLPPTKHVSAGVVLATQDEKPSHVRLIRSGIVMLSYLDRSGQEFIVGLRTEGWWISPLQVLLDVPNLFTVTTLTSCSYSSIAADDFLQQQLKNPCMMRHYLSSVCREVVSQSKLHIMHQSVGVESRLR